MPICVEICGAEQKYMPFFGTITERDFRKKSKAQKHIPNDTMLLFGFRLGTVLDDGTALWIFSRIRRRIKMPFSLALKFVHYQPRRFILAQGCPLLGVNLWQKDMTQHILSNYRTIFYAKLVFFIFYVYINSCKVLVQPPPKSYFGVI